MQQQQQTPEQLLYEQNLYQGFRNEILKLACQLESPPASLVDPQRKNVDDVTVGQVNECVKKFKEKVGEDERVKPRLPQWHEALKKEIKDNTFAVREKKKAEKESQKAARAAKAAEKGKGKEKEGSSSMVTNKEEGVSLFAPVGSGYAPAPLVAAPPVAAAAAAAAAKGKGGSVRGGRGGGKKVVGEEGPDAVRLDIRVSRDGFMKLLKSGSIEIGF
jgi:hypothetical protein